MSHKMHSTCETWWKSDHESLAAQRMETQVSEESQLTFKVCIENFCGNLRHQIWDILNSISLLLNAYLNTWRFMARRGNDARDGVWTSAGKGSACGVEKVPTHFERRSIEASGMYSRGFESPGKLIGYHQWEEERPFKNFTVKIDQNVSPIYPHLQSWSKAQQWTRL